MADKVLSTSRRVTHSILTKTSLRWILFLLYFNRRREAQKNWVICSRSHSKLEAVPGFEPRHRGSGVDMQNCYAEAPTNMRYMLSPLAEPSMTHCSQPYSYPMVTLNEWPPLFFRENTQVPCLADLCQLPSINFSEFSLFSQNKCPRALNPTLSCCLREPALRLSILHLQSLLHFPCQPVNVWVYHLQNKTKHQTLLWSSSTFNSIILATTSLCDPG